MVDALLDAPKGKVSRFHEVLLGGSDACDDAHVGVLLARAPRFANAIDGAVLLAALQRSSPYFISNGVIRTCISQSESPAICRRLLWWAPRAGDCERTRERKVCPGFRRWETNLGPYGAARAQIWGVSGASGSGWSGVGIVARKLCKVRRNAHCTF